MTAQEILTAIDAGVEQGTRIEESVAALIASQQAQIEAQAAAINNLQAAVNAHASAIAALEWRRP